MDSHDRDHRLLAAFLAGELDPAEARRWDEHLLECEGCWRAVREDRAGRQAARLLRQPAPPGLADRVAFAVEVAAAGCVAAQRRTGRGISSGRLGRHGRRVRWRLAGSGMLAAGLAVLLMVLLLPGGRQTGGVPAAVAAVARYAQAIRPPAGGQHFYSGGRAAPVQVGRLATVTAGGQRIVLRTWRLGGTEAVVATSGRPFPMPARARGVLIGRWRGRRGWAGWACTASTAGYRSWWRRRSRRGSLPRWRRGCPWPDGGTGGRDTRGGAACPDNRLRPRA